MNREKAPVMAQFLDSAGFPITQIPMAKLDQAQLLAWLEDVRAFYDDGGDE
jgi:hypothetical protein